MRSRARPGSCGGSTVRVGRAGMAAGGGRGTTQVMTRPSVSTGMSSLRRDIAQAQARMRVTFGIRTAIGNLHESLDLGELVREMVACWYCGGDGLLVLTDTRVLAVRDDYSTFRLQHVALRQTTAVDYAPAVHDGLAVLTDHGRVAVRTMNRQDSDRLVTALTDRRPGPLVGADPLRRAADTPHPEPDRHPPGRTPDQDDASPEQTPGPVAVANNDRDVLLGVLADLHAQGILTAEELAAKIAVVAARPPGLLDPTNAPDTRRRG